MIEYNGNTSSLADLSKTGLTKPCLLFKKKHVAIVITHCPPRLNHSLWIKPEINKFEYIRFPTKRTRNKCISIQRETNLQVYIL